MELNAEYESILSEMENAREKALSNTGKQEDSRHDRLIKFLSGGALWFLIAVIGFVLLSLFPESAIELLPLFSLALPLCA